MRTFAKKLIAPSSQDAARASEARKSLSASAESSCIAVPGPPSSLWQQRISSA